MSKEYSKIKMICKKLIIKNYKNYSVTSRTPLILRNKNKIRAATPIPLANDATAIMIVPIGGSAAPIPSTVTQTMSKTIPEYPSFISIVNP